MSIAKRKRRARLLFDPKNFPALNADNHKVTSDPADHQNCIAYAAGDSNRFWRPIPDYPEQLPSPYFWPRACPLEETLEAFAVAFQTVGFKKCERHEEESLEDNIEKIAIYAKLTGSSIEPTHAAVQSPWRNGKWRSKMGEDEDIEHDLPSLEGSHYGQVKLFMWRSLEDKRVHLASLNKRRPPSH